MNKARAESISSQVQFLSDMIQTGPLYSSPAGQLECAHLIADTLLSFGWDDVTVQRYDSNELMHDSSYVPVESFGPDYVDDGAREKYNVIGVLNADRPGKNLILNGHYDVEPIADERQWTHHWASGKVSGDRVWGRGASDMLGGLSSQIYTASRFAEDRSAWEGSIIFNAVPDEEIGGNGTLAALHQMRQMDLLDDVRENSCLIAEPSDGVIALESLGFMHMILKAKGVPRHMAGARPEDNILYDMMAAIGGFDDVLRDALWQTTRAVDIPRYTFGIINGGSDAATPMASIETEATILYPPHIDPLRLMNSIAETLPHFANKVKASFSDFYFDGHKSQPGKLSWALLSTKPRSVTDIGIFPSPCDARLFTANGIDEVIVYGPGSLSQAHGADEYIEMAELAAYNSHTEQAMRRYLTPEKKT